MAYDEERAARLRGAFTAGPPDFSPDRPPWLVCALLSLLPACAAAPVVPARFEASPCPEVQADADGKAVVTGFYEAFSRRDFRGMACAYAPDIEFTDSIFGTLRGKRALAMWAMLTSQGGDLQIQYSQVGGDATTGHAHWDAQYRFPFLAFTNPVENRIDATFELRDGKIVRHRDRFDLRRWMVQALWPLGGIISESTIRDGVQKKLDEFIERHPELQDTPSLPNP
jgi:limonene-1,2-epoxide hydrolase